jgi:hypothetical protein
LKGYIARQRAANGQETQKARPGPRQSVC